MEDEVVDLEAVVVHAPVSEGEAVAHVPALVAAAGAPGQILVVGVARRGPISIQVVPADLPHRHGPAFHDHRLPLRGLGHHQLRVPVVDRSAMAIPVHRSPINRAALVVAILGWVTDLG